MFFDQSGVLPLVPPDYIEYVRIVNICLGTVAAVCLIYALSNWIGRSTAERLRWMSVFLFILSGTYGTFEAAYLHTYIRVYMVTVSLLWAIMAALWPAGESKQPDGT